MATIQEMIELHNRVSSSDSLDSVDFESFHEDPDSAEWKYKKIMEQCKAFQDNLDNEHEIGICLASFGTTIQMAVRHLGFQNPDILYFYGMVDGNYAQLIQHMTQLNFLLIAVKKPDPHKPAFRLGFQPPNED